jgi:uncharacterized protein (DUF1778 family)
MHTVEMVLIPLIDIARSGPSKVLVRLTEEDKALVDIAAKRIGMNQAEFTRTVIAQAARKVISETGGSSDG